MEGQSAGLRITVDQQALAVTPGEAATATATIHNTGTQVEDFALNIEGPGWVSVEPRTLQVFPGEQATASLQAEPPREPSVTAGVSSLRLAASSMVHPGVTAAIGVRLEVAAFRRFDAEITPPATRGNSRTAYHLLLFNGGNVPLRASIDSSDGDGLLQFRHAPLAELGPGQRLDIDVAVQAPRRWIGQPKTTMFTVVVDTRDGPPTRLTASRTLVPVLPPWGAALAAVAAAGVLAAGGALLATRDDAKPPHALEVSRTGAASTGASGIAGSSGASAASSAAASPSSSAQASASSSGGGSSSPSGGAARVALPDPSGKTLDDAQAELRARGLGVQVRRVVSNTVPRGEVMSSQPAADTMVAAGDSVTLVVSAGPTPTEDLIALAPSATWISGNGAKLVVDRDVGSLDGYVAIRRGVELEDGATGSRLLLTAPPGLQAGHSVVGGTYRLKTPLIRGDHLRGEVGFVAGSTGTADIKILATKSGQQADPRAEDQTVWRVTDTAGDGKVRCVDLDLTDYQGATQVTLWVDETNHSSSQDSLAWLDLRVEGGPGDASGTHACS